MREFVKLSRNEMKNVLGGLKQVSCSYSGSGGNGSYPCSGSVDDCQAVADTLCGGSDGCDDIDCR